MVLISVQYLLRAFLLGHGIADGITWQKQRNIARESLMSKLSQ
jgi:hypothetical protein